MPYAVTEKFCVQDYSKFHTWETIGGYFSRRESKYMDIKWCDTCGCHASFDDDKMIEGSFEEPRIYK